MNNTTNLKTLAFLISLLFISLVSPSAYSKSLKGFENVNFKDSQELKGKSLQLNGLGARLATWFNVKVYVAGLYLEEKNNNPEKILSSSGTKVLKLHFVREVDKVKLQEAWDEGFKKNADKTQLAALEKKIVELKSFTPAVKEGDELEIHFYPSEVEVYLNNQLSGKIAGEDFSRTLLSVWIGQNPPNKSLKEGLLGL